MRRTSLYIFLFIFLCIALFFFAFIPAQAARLYGPASPRLGLVKRVEYSLRLLWHDGLLTVPADPNGSSMLFTVNQGDPVSDVAYRLEQLGLIRNATAFVDYLVYMGIDTSLQAGSYDLSSSMSMVDIARDMQDASPLDVTFVVLPGWRMEEIAASLPTSGLDVTPEQFLQVGRDPFYLDFMTEASSSEGMLFPDTYILPRSTNAEGLVKILVRNFSQHMTVELRDGFKKQGLTVYQAVIVASLVQRESVQAEEMPIIASVFLNRLDAGWNLESDPTVQYAVGTDGNWWPNPLSVYDLDFDSPFNTYLYPGLPPAPIANPGMEALEAVSQPADTNYYFFRARCDGSGLHNFAATLEEHINNGCD